MHLGSKESQAGLWLAKQERGLSQRERVLFELWLKKDPLHEATLFECQVVWQGMDLLSNRAKARVGSSKPTNARTTFRNKSIWVLGTAALLIIAISLFFTSPKDSSTDENPTFVYETDGYKRHVLPDESVLELKPGTRIQVEYTVRRRTVYLERGEVFFDVQGNSGRPFVVESELGLVTALGTEFTVKQGEQLLEVWVVEGKVKVSKKEDSSASVEKGTKPVNELSAGQMIIQEVSADSFQTKIVDVSEQELKVQLEWKDQILDFVSAPLYEIIAEFNRLNDIKIIITDDELKTQRLTVTMKPNNYRDFIDLLILTLGVEAEYTNNLIFLSKAQEIQ